MTVQWVLIEGEPYLSRAVAFREEKARVTKTVNAFLKEVGAEAISHSFTLLRFPGWKQPEGFKAPDKHGMCAPRKENKHMIDRLAALPRPPVGWSVIPYDEIPYQLTYADKDDPGRHGAGMIGPPGAFWDGADIGWAGDTYFARIPDWKAAAAAYKLGHPNDVFPDHNGMNPETFEIPAGLRKVSEAEIDLIVATEKVRIERETKK